MCTVFDVIYTIQDVTSVHTGIMVRDIRKGFISLTNPLFN